MIEFETDGLTPAMRGRLEAHLRKLVRNKAGEVVTFRDLYSSGEFVTRSRYMAYNDATGERDRAEYTLWRADGETGTPVPKLVFDTITLPDVTEGRAA